MTAPKFIVAVLALALIGGGAGLLQRLKANQRLGVPGVKTAEIPGDKRLRIALPENVPAFVSTNLEPTEVELRTLPSDTSISRRLYRAADGFEAMVNVVLMGSDRTSIHKPEFCLTAQGWVIGQRELTPVSIPRPQPYELVVQRYTARADLKDETGQVNTWSGIYLFWFVAEDKLTASHWARVTWSTQELLRRGVLPRWAYVACFSVCRPGHEEATVARMKQFLAAAVPEFQLVTPPAGTPRLTER